MISKSLKIKPIILALICSFSLILLSACGNNAKEPVLQTENKKTVEKVDIDEREIIEIEEKESHVSLTEVTWEDFEDSVGAPVLHFFFSNGTIVDKELHDMSIVKSIAYQDITGDGVDEVIVYREFVNYIHDDFFLMDFFKIEGDTITEISPSTDIPELADIPWDTEVVSDSTEGYKILLTMESYGKTAGILYTDTIMTVGYGHEGWEVVQQQRIPDWKLAYLDYLVTNTDAVAADNWLFWLAYVDGDTIPELFFHANNAQFIVSFLTCEHGKVKELGEFGGQGAALWYQEKEGNILCFGAMMGNSALTAYHFRNGELEERGHAYTEIPPSMDESLASWYWDEEEVSKEEYEKRSEDVIKQMTNRVEYEKGMRFDELWEILGSVEIVNSDIN